MITPLEVKLAYARAEWSKPSGTRELILRSSTRERLYDASTWRRELLPLARCQIHWPMGMGWREWAKGPLPYVAAEFRKRPEDPLWSLVRDINDGLPMLPLIVIEFGTELHVDDGCHRAVAQLLAGIDAADAFVGKPDFDKLKRQQ